MLANARRTDALSATAILVKMAAERAVLPRRMASEHHGIYVGQMLFTPLMFESSEGTMQSCWRRIGLDSRHGTGGAFGGAFRDALAGHSGDPDWVRDMYVASRGAISDEHIVSMFDAIEVAVYGDLDSLDATLGSIDLRRLAPEFIVGIPRALFPLKEHLFNWRSFVLKGWTELSARPGLDVRELLQGLL
jgi:hypothetical protein